MEIVLLFICMIVSRTEDRKLIMYIERPCRKMAGPLYGDSLSKNFKEYIFDQILIDILLDNTQSYLMNYRLL